MAVARAAVWMGCLLALAGTGAAAGTAEGDDLTALGAQRTGNAEGTIPAWTGGLTEPPAGYSAAEQHVDPYAGDAVLHVVSAANAAQFSDNLSEGQRALLDAYPQTWHMNVYPTRRSASYPPFVYAAVIENATTARLKPGKGGVSGSSVSSPFPRPKDGAEAIWNHTLRWRGQRITRGEGWAAVTARGRYQVVSSAQDLAFAYGWPAAQANAERSFGNVLLAIKARILMPSQLTGRGTLVLETIDQTTDPRKVWLYLPAVRRMVRAPDYGYAAPAPFTDGLRTIDQFDLFSGPTDRFDWKLLGKREMLIPYNAYRVHAGSLTPHDIVGARHLNPELLRYELHRVWVVEARLKPGAKHVYGRRVFYLDEDSWQIALNDNYDLTGVLWRTAEAHALNYYEVPVLWSTLLAYYDLRQGRYLVEGLDNARPPYRFSDAADPREFTPNELNYYWR